MPNRPAANRRAVLFSGALAAGLAAVAVSGLWPQADERLVLRTAKGELRKVALADGSIVSMNGGSHIEVALSDTERHIGVVAGEAWFEVAKDPARPFVVAAGAVRVRAVGTAFAVRRGADGAHVLVTEGVVDVWSGQGGAGGRRMAAGRRAFVANQAGPIQVALDPDGIARQLAWRAGQLVFGSESLAEAVASFNRQNVRQIVIADPALQRKTLVGTYRIDEQERFADDVRALWNVPVKVGPDSIRIGAAPGTASGTASGITRSRGAE